MAEKQKNEAGAEGCLGSDLKGLINLLSLFPSAILKSLILYPFVDHLNLLDDAEHRIGTDFKGLITLLSLFHSANLKSFLL